MYVIMKLLSVLTWDIFTRKLFHHNCCHSLCLPNQSVASVLLEYVQPVLHGQVHTQGGIIFPLLFDNWSLLWMNACWKEPTYKVKYYTNQDTSLLFTWQDIYLPSEKLSLRLLWTSCQWSSRWGSWWRHWWQEGGD